MPPRSQARPVQRATLRSAEGGKRGAKPTRASNRSVALPIGLRQFARRSVYLACAVAIALGAARLLADPTFQVGQVEVRGSRYLSQETVMRTAEVVGTNIFRVSASRARKQVMSTGVPEAITIELRLPSSVTIAVDERPAAYLWQSGTALVAISEDGTVLGPTTTDHPAISVVDLDRQEVEVGKVVDVRRLREAAYVLRTIPLVAGFIPGTVDLSAALGVSIVTPDGFTVAIGDDTDLAGKLESLGPVLFAARRARPLPTTIDLRFVGHPVFR